MSIYVAGSLAFDRIMSFNGAFADHILADKLHILNVSFLIDGLVEKRGGCAGNIAYTLALMGAQLVRPWPESTLPVLNIDALEPLL